jgi:hypothetical protein
MGNPNFPEAISYINILIVKGTIIMVLIYVAKV